MGSSRKWLNVIGSKKQSSSVNTKAASANEKPSGWRLWKCFLLIKRKSIFAGNKEIGDIEKTNVATEESAAICIQTAFRAFLAKKALRALKGLVRLQAAISGHDSRKQSAASLQCVQAFVRVQARICRERAIQSRDVVGLSKQMHCGLTLEPCTADSEIKWCDAPGTVEEVRAKEQQKQVASLKRDRAIAYAFCNKWKSNVKVNPGSLFDVELDNSTWSWIWLDEWLNGQAKEHINGNRGSQRATNLDTTARKVVQKKSAPVGFRSYLSSKVSSGRLTETKKMLKREGSPGKTVPKARAGKGKGVKVLAFKPNAKLQPGHSLNQSKQRGLSGNHSKQHSSKDAAIKKMAFVKKPK